jgi:hypothetical protein
VAYDDTAVGMSDQDDVAQVSPRLPQRSSRRKNSEL